MRAKPTCIATLWLVELCSAALPLRAAAPPAPTELDAVRVLAHRDSGAYVPEPALGSKTSLALRRLPQAVRTLPRSLLDDLGATRLDATLDYLGGVSRQNDFGGMWDNFAIRGLPGNENAGGAMLLNGLSAQRGYHAPRDMANVERIEFLKGPAAALYGASEPGGTLNLVTKLPQWRRATALEVSAGQPASARLAADATGPLTDELAYRLNIAVERRPGVRDHVRIARRFLAPAFSWRLSERIGLEYTGEWLDHHAPLDRGTVAVERRLGRLPRSRFLGEPADGDLQITNRGHQLVLDGWLDERWSVRAAAAYQGSALRGFSSEPARLAGDDRTLWRQRRYRHHVSQDRALQAELHGELPSRSLRHALVLGAEIYDYRQEQLTRRTRPSALAPYALDVFAPRYGQPRPEPLPYVDIQLDQRNAALYFQDAVELGTDWTLLFGLRHDRHRQALQDRRSTARFVQTLARTTPRLGLSYAPPGPWSFYVNAGRSFRPNDAMDVWSGDPEASSPPPELGRAYEAGAKWQRSDERAGGTLALFDIEKRHVLTGDPTRPGHRLAAGRVGSRGLEGDFSGQFGEHWRGGASFAWTAVHVREDNTLQAGSGLINVPRLSASVFAIHEWPAAGGRVGLGATLTHTGRRLGQAYTRAEHRAGSPAFHLPAYTRVGLLAHWQVDARLKLSLDVDNLLDRRYYPSAVAGTPWIAEGAGRTVTGSARWAF